MKNKRLELFKKSAKRHRYPPHAYIKDGVRIYHDYTNPRTKAYWDDCGFKINGDYHLVLFTHPRYEYYEHCDMLAYEKATKIRNEQNPQRSNWLDSFIPVKKRVPSGLRKKIMYYESLRDDSENEQEMYSNWKKFRDEELNGPFVQKAFFKVFQKDYCKQIQICIPFEVLNEDDLIELTKKVRTYLKDPYAFNREWGNYEFTKVQYAEELKEDENGK